MMGPSAPGGSLDAKDIKVLVETAAGEIVEKTVAEALGDLNTIGGPLLGRPIDGTTSALDQPIDSPE